MDTGAATLTLAAWLAVPQLWSAWLPKPADCYAQTDPAGQAELRRQWLLALTSVTAVTVVAGAMLARSDRRAASLLVLGAGVLGLGLAAESRRAIDAAPATASAHLAPTQGWT